MTSINGKSTGSTHKYRVLVVTGADQSHFDLAEDLIQSLRDCQQQPLTIGFVRLCKEPLNEQIAASVDHVADGWAGQPTRQGPAPGYLIGYLGVKARLPQLFPGYEIYIWLDADCWLQSDRGLEELARSAMRQSDICVAIEADEHFAPRLNHHRNLGYLFDLLEHDGPSRRAEFERYPSYNSGVFAARGNSPLWSRWLATIERLRTAEAEGKPILYSDQTCLNYLLYTKGVQRTALRTKNNWQPYFALPLIDRLGRLRLPTPPHELINIVHLSGDLKDIELPSTATGGIRTLRYRQLRLYQRWPDGRLRNAGEEIAVS